jgi:hypothetical protein
MKANFLKLLFLTLLICLGCALVSCSIITPTSKESEYEKFSKTFTLTLNENGDGYVVHGFSSSWDSSQANITIPDYIDGIPVTEIANSAFNNQNSFNTFYLPDTLKVLGEFAIPEEAGNIIIKGGVKYLGSKTNPYVVAVQSASEDQPTMTFVEGCKFINSYFKFRNSTITDITFPSSLLQINGFAFSHCKIKELNFNEGLRTIGDSTFSGCSDLTKINLPNSLEKIGTNAFNCSITELFIPKNVQELGERAFQSSALTEITVDNENNYVYGIPVDEDPADFFTTTGYIEVVANGKGETSATGAKLNLYDKQGGSLVKSYTIIIFGDVNGDAAIDDGDSMDIERYVYYVDDDFKLGEVGYFAADVDGNDSIEDTDSMLIEKYVYYVIDELSVNPYA